MNLEIIVHTAALTTALIESFKEVTAAKSTIFRTVATELIPLIHERIHVQGKAGNGKDIGEYSNEYMKVRTGDYGNSDRVTRGANKGKTKNAGTVTRGGRAGAARSKYNRSGDRRVILSLTRQLENDYAVIATDEGWGIGFNNAHNTDKANWNNKRYGATIYELTDSEREYAVKRITELVTKALA